jgi:serine protease Do
LAEGLHLSQHWGVVVADVKPGGPAEAAGLQIQDIILSADDRRIETLPSLSAALYLHRLDQVVKLEVLRGKEKMIINIPAIEHHDQMDQLLDTVNPENSLIQRLGILAIDISGDLGTKLSSVLRNPTGVIVVGRAIELITPETGLQTGDVIHQLNTQPIDSSQTLRAAVDKLKPGDAVVLQVEREGEFTFVSFEME